MIQIELTNKNLLRINTTKNYTISDAILLCLNGVLHFANQAVELADPAEKDEFKKQMYDMLNLRMSGLLETFAPEYELRPGLTEKALLDAENKVLEDEMSAMQK